MTARLTGLRSALKAGAAQALHWTGASRLLGRGLGRRREPFIAAYHRVVDDFAHHAQSAIPSLLVGVAMLERQLDALGREFEFAALDELDSRSRGRRQAAITFDDGYADVYHHAFPLLRRKGIPFAVFVVTDLVGSDAVQLHDALYFRLARSFKAGRDRLDRLRDLCRCAGLSPAACARVAAAGRDAYRALRAVLAVTAADERRRLLALLEADDGRIAPELDAARALTWPMLDELQRAGVAVGSHTRTHALLAGESAATLARETRDSKRVLEQRLRAPVTHFAYPDGRFDPAAVRAVAAAGYRRAYTVCRHRDPTWPELTVPRRALWEASFAGLGSRCSPALLDCETNGVFDLVARCPQSHLA